MTDNTEPTQKEPELRTTGRGFTYSVDNEPEEDYFPTEGAYSTDGNDTYVMEDEKWRNIDHVIGVHNPKTGHSTRMRVSELTKYITDNLETGEYIEVIYLR